MFGMKIKNIGETLDTIPYGMMGCEAKSLKECWGCRFPNATEQCSRLYSLMRIDKKTPRCEIVVRRGMMKEIWRTPDGRFAKKLSKDDSKGWR